MPCCSLPAAGDALLRQKLGLLNFSFAAGWDPTEMLPVYLAAACDPSEQVEDFFYFGVLLQGLAWMCPLHRWGGMLWCHACFPCA